MIFQSECNKDITTIIDGFQITKRDDAKFKVLVEYLKTQGHTADNYQHNRKQASQIPAMDLTVHCPTDIQIFGVPVWVMKYYEGARRGFTNVSKKIAYFLESEIKVRKHVQQPLIVNITPSKTLDSTVNHFAITFKLSPVKRSFEKSVGQVIEVYRGFAYVYNFFTGEMEVYHRDEWRDVNANPQINGLISWLMK
jgi:hypothetical protein